MCGRYTNETEFSQIGLLFQASDGTFRPWTPKYNISPSAKPGFEQLIVTADRQGSLGQGSPGARKLRLARFWLIPSFWSKPLSLLPTAFNARSEDLGQKRFWQQPYAHSRCLVPTTGWREFVAVSAEARADKAGKSTGRKSAPKQPYHFRPRNADGSTPLAFAGLWSTWTSPEGEVVDSFAILTTTPSPTAGQIHDRMPLVLPADLYDAWLTDDARRDEVLSSARDYASQLELEIFPSDPVANSVHFEGPDACRPIDLDATRTARAAQGRRAAQPSQLSLLDQLPTPSRRS